MNLLESGAVHVAAHNLLHVAQHAHPSGSQLKMPGATRRTYPARTSRRWLGTSASAGSSRSVRRNSDDIRNSTGTLPVD